MSWDELKPRAPLQILEFVTGSGRISHAYLFLGPEGAGKRLAALNFAKRLNCNGENPPCDGCEACSMIDRAAHPDVNVTLPDERRGSIKIDQIRNIQQRICLKPSMAKTKVEIVIDSDGMTQEAQNAFLKTLEEPPAESVLILTARNAQALLLTIRSRCQILKFLHGFFMDSELSSMRDGFFAGGEFELPVPFGQTVSPLRGQKVSPLRAEGVPLAGRDVSRDSGENAQNRILGLLCAIYRDALLVKTGLGPDFLINADKVREIGNIAERHSFEDIEAMVEAIGRSYDYLQQNVSSKLVFLALSERLRCFQPCR